MHNKTLYLSITVSYGSVSYQSYFELLYVVIIMTVF